MELNQLLFQSDDQKPYIKENNDKIKYIIDLKKFKIIDAHVLLLLQKEMNYILKNRNEFNDKELVLILNIEANYFRDKTVVLLLELLLFSLLEVVNIQLYLNVKIRKKSSIFHNYFTYSYLYTINRKFINSKDYCLNYINFSGFGYDIYKKDIIGVGFRKCFFIEEFKAEEEYLLYQQILSSDICSTLKVILDNEKTLHETCSIVDELVDNILCHTNAGLGLIDIGVVKVASSKDNDEYYQFMINIINVSENCLYSNLKNAFNNEQIELKNRDVLQYSYSCQFDGFNDDNYSENLFFMVSAFQKGTTTRTINRRGGTGLNNSIVNFAKKAQNKMDDHQSYVYSGHDILMFDYDILNKSKIGNYIAFNFENNYNKKPDEKCLSKSVFYLNGTAYNLMFIVKGRD